MPFKFYTFSAIKEYLTLTNFNVAFLGVFSYKTTDLNKGCI